ncbi:hypothetical protein BDZ97DRAFT_1931144 [Flammula alnicola]|nr:hypothetical protein BDZ97DRAFT_1931144 [Flammula alnicola]
MALSRFKLVFFAPKDSTKTILGHLFRKFPEELGKIGNYEHCAFITRGTERAFAALRGALIFVLGQFMPKASANPVIGAVGQLEFVEEDRVELVVNDKGEHEELRRAIKELKNVHPYEEVAYDVYKLENF